MNEPLRVEAVGNARLQMATDQLALPPAPAAPCGQLVFVVADVGDLVRDDQMVFGIHNPLHVVADPAGAFAVSGLALPVGADASTEPGSNSRRDKSSAA